MVCRDSKLEDFFMPRPGPKSSLDLKASGNSEDVKSVKVTPILPITAAGKKPITQVVIT